MHQYHLPRHPILNLYNTPHHPQPTTFPEIRIRSSKFEPFDLIMSLNYISPIDPRLPFPGTPNSPRTTSVPANSLPMISVSSKDPLEMKMKKLLDMGDTAVPRRVCSVFDSAEESSERKWRAR
ncbi:hypothetical protein LINPERHAP1_LOCUS40672 [Linum perenne]